MMLSGAHLPVPNAVLLKPSSCPSRGTGRKYQCGPVRCGREQRFLTANIFHYRLAYRPVAWSLSGNQATLVVGQPQERWSHFLRQPVKVDLTTQRTIHHEDTETIFG